MISLKFAQQHYAATNLEYQVFRNYYRGKHASVISAELADSDFMRVFQRLCDNLCKRVIRTTSDRLKLQGWDSADKSVATFLADWAAGNKLNSFSKITHLRGLLYGDGYVSVWPDKDGKPTIHQERTENTVVKYDIDGNICAAVKYWVEDVPGSDDAHRMRLNVYEPHETRRYFLLGDSVSIPASESALTPFAEDADGPVVANPYDTVPIFHFSNGLDGEDFAQSELVDIIHIQDALNKTLLDLMTASEFQGFKQRWMTGFDPEIDPATGKIKPAMQTGIARILSLPDGATMGELAGSDLKPLIDLVNDLRVEIARVSATPLHTFMLNSGDYPSGEALKTAEAPLLSKVDDLCACWGDVWESIAKFVCSIAGMNGDDVTASWLDTTPHSDKEQSETGINKLSLGVSKPQIQRELGYSEAEIETMAKETAEASQTAAERAQAAFNAGS